MRRRYDTEWGSERRARLRDFYHAWQGRMREVDFNTLGPEGRIDHILLSRRLAYELSLLDREDRQDRLGRRDGVPPDATAARKSRSWAGTAASWRSCIVATDLHVPFHDPDVVLDFCSTADTLGIKTLVIGGDLFHADTVSKYIGVGKQVPITTELESTSRVLAALLEVFDRIVCVPGNHDQRIERAIAQMQDTKEGRRGLEMVARLLGAPDPQDAEDVSLRYLRHFFGSPKVEWHALPDVTINGTWLVMHPGTVSRIAPQTERAMARKHRMSVLQGHSHSWGLGFEESGTDVCFNVGHCCDPTKFRYIREKPSTFPASVQGYGVIYQTKDNPRGRLIPVAVHDQMFRTGSREENAA